MEICKLPIGGKNAPPPPNSTILGQFSFRRVGETLAKMLSDWQPSFF